MYTPFRRPNYDAVLAAPTHREAHQPKRMSTHAAWTAPLQGERAVPDNLKVISADRWRPVNRGGDFSAIVVCPECGRDASLGSHTIDSKGIVWPRVRCPWNRKLHPELTDRMNRDKAQDCTFHAGVRLDNWPPVDLGQVLGMPSGAQVPLATPPNQDYTA